MSAQRYVDYFTPSVHQLRVMADAFSHELKLGLDAHARSPNTWKPSVCSFKMLDSCVVKLPTGQEQGVSRYFNESIINSSMLYHSCTL